MAQSSSIYPTQSDVTAGWTIPSRPFEGEDVCMGDVNGDVIIDLVAPFGAFI